MQRDDHPYANNADRFTSKMEAKHGKGLENMKKRILGIDIGGTKCAVVLAHLHKGIQIDDKIQFETLTERGKDDVLKRLFGAIDAVLSRHSLSPHQLLAIGISCGGPLDSKTGVILGPPNLPGWENVPLTQIFSEKFNVPVYLQNDANACALVEWKLGAGRGARNMIFLTMGTGMGAGIVAEGNLICGMNSMGGEVGHLRLSGDGPVGFGKAGSFEGYVSGSGITNQAKDLTLRLCREGTPPQWIQDGVAHGEITAKLIADYAKAGDPHAESIYTKAGEMLGRGLSILVDTLNPERIVIGSIFVRCEELLRPAMEAALQEEAIALSLNGLKILPAMTGETLGDLACIMVALYSLNIDPYESEYAYSPKVLAPMERAIRRNPAIERNRDQILNTYTILKTGFASGNKLLIAGNGGSCADALHIAGELMKGFNLKRPLASDDQQIIRHYTLESKPDAHAKLQNALPVIVLSEHSTVTTAFANDVDAELVFSQQVLAYGRHGDVFLGISTSGNARNVLIAAQVAKARGLTVIVLTGGTGGKLVSLADEAIIAEGDSTPDIQELHQPIYHALCAMLEEYFFGNDRPSHRRNVCAANTALRIWQR